jgi:hypothetical protein
MDPSKSDATEVAADELVSSPVGVRPPIALDDWELDDDLCAVDRLASSLRIDSGHASMPPRPAMADRQSSQSPEVRRDRRRRRKPVAIALAWSILSLGLVAFIFGGALLAWSFVASRGDLWAWGMPLTLGGQALLLIGVVLQLDGLWQNNCQTAEALDELDEQIGSLRHSTSLLGSTHSTAAQSFYAHVADGASPQMLLADLKGQLDILAVKLAQQKC